MLPSNLNLSIENTKGHNNKILVSNTDMKIASNRDINSDHNKLTLPDVSNTVIPTARHDPVGTTIPHNLKMLTKKHNDEKLVITLLLVGTSLTAYRWCRGKCISLKRHYFCL